MLLKCVLVIAAVQAQPAKSNAIANKFNTQVEKGDRNFDRFHYQAALDHYKKAFENKKSSQLSLKIATCYRLLNQPLETEFWYNLTIKIGEELAADDMLHYAQALRANEKYDEALEIYEAHLPHAPWVSKQVEALKNRHTFFQNQDAYSVEWASFNSSEKDFSPVYFKDDIVFVSNRSSSGKTFGWDESYYLELFVADEHDEIEPFSKKINTGFHEGPATFYENGSKMLFTRNNYLNSKMNATKDGVNKLKIYSSEQVNNGWITPTEFPYSSDEYTTAHPSVSMDGKVLYFASDMPGGYGGVDLYMSTFANESWSLPVNLGPKINTEQDEMFPFIHKGNVLYFSSTGHAGLGGLDIFRVYLDGDGVVENLGYPVNTNSDDFGIAFYKNTNEAHFSSNRQGGMGDDDIYSVFLYDYIIDLVLVDGVTGEQIETSGRIDVLKTRRAEVLNNGITVSETAITFGVEAGTSFFATGSADGYYQGNLIIQLKEEEVRGVQKLSYEIPLTKLEGKQDAEILVVVNNDAPTQLFFLLQDENYPFDGTLSELKKYLYEKDYEIVKETYLTNILYDFDRYDIRADAARGLDKVIQYLKADKELNIILESHTDVRGSNQYNQMLAKKRVKAAKQYLMNGGIHRDRIFIGSYGEEKTIMDCVGECDEDIHQKNRRTEIKIEVNKRKGMDKLSAYTGF